MTDTMISRSIWYGLLACSIMAIQACQAPSAVQSPAAQAVTQPVSIEFRVVPEGRNPSTCRRFDTPLSRVHTLTASGTTASLTSSGGINSAMTQTAPRVYTTSYSLGQVTLNVVADASKTPKTLVVTEARLGCRWTAVAP